MIRNFGSGLSRWRLIVCMAGVLCMLFNPGLRGDAYAGEVIFEFEVTETRGLNGRFAVSAGHEIAVDWGDGTEDTFSGGWAVFEKEYEEPVNTKVRVIGKDGSVLKHFILTRASADVSFSLDDLPEGLNYFLVLENNTVEGDISGLPEGLTYFNLSGSNTVTGNIAGLPAGLTYFSCDGSNTISGDISDLPGTLTFFSCRGSNTVGGDISDLPEALTLLRVTGANTIRGDVSGLPAGLKTLHLYGKNTLSGDLSELPAGLASLIIEGENTVAGDIAGLPEELTLVVLDGFNTVRGDISDLPGGVDTFSCVGRNTVKGDIAALPAGLGRVRISGSNELSYTAGREWAEVMREFIISPDRGYGLGRHEVDNLLIDLAKSTWAGRKYIYLSGNNSSRSRASDDALGKLLGMGVTVSVVENGQAITR